MQRIRFSRLGLVTGTVLSAVSLAIIPASALAGTRTAAAANTATAANQAKLKLIISRGDNEINRRLTTLNTLSSKISSATKLSAGDKSTLSNEVSSEISGLTNLKTKLDADTDVATARSDAQTIISGYRVYALIVPKVLLVKTADDQQVAEAKLTTLAAKLQSRITTAQNAGKNVSAIQTQLNNLNSKVSTAQSISSSVESSVVNLQPSDYNSNHSVLSGDRDKLKTAQSDIQTATSEAKNIVSALKNL